MIYVIIYGTDILSGETMMSLINMPVMLVVQILLFFITALGEEIGWRGFLGPKLTVLFGFKKGVLMSGIIWAIWHFPMMLTGYGSIGIPMWFQSMLFTINGSSNIYI